MKKLHWGCLAGLLLVSSLSLQAAEKRYQIRLAASDGDIFGKPVAFQEITPPGPTPLNVPGPAPSNEPPSLQPIPEPSSPGRIVPQPGGANFQTVELYDRVEIDDLDNVHPQAVKKIVAVKDPCAKRNVCGSCTPPCVYVMICVPPCDKFKFEVKRSDHSKVEYDYGDYEVEITSKDGIVEIDYDD